MLNEKSQTTSQRRLTLLAFCLTFGFSVIAAQLVRYQVLLHSSLKDFRTSLPYGVASTMS